MTVEDRDLGLKKIYANAKRFPRTFTVGVHDPELLTHAVAHEMESGSMRAAFDDRQPAVDKELQALHADVVTGANPEPIQLQIAEGYRDAFREAMDELKDRDDVLRDAIGVEVAE